MPNPHQNNGWQNGPKNGSRNNQGQGGYRSNYPPPAEIKTSPIPDDYLDQAEEIMRNNVKGITTSKIRRLYSLVIEIYNRENLRTESDLDPQSIADINMARVRFAYECGRDSNVKRFIEKTHLLEYMKGIGSSRTDFIKFARYMEALIAYHKYFGGSEFGRKEAE